MDILVPIDRHRAPSPHGTEIRFRDFRVPLSWLFPGNAVGSGPSPTGKLVVQIAAVFLAYFIAGKLGQATTNIRSSNLGRCGRPTGSLLPLSWPMAIECGPESRRALFSSHSRVQSSARRSRSGDWRHGGRTHRRLLFRRIPDFDPSLSRLRDALGLIVLGAFGSAILSASIGMFSLYATGVQAYSGLASAWLIYWLGDSTGVLLVTPLVFTLPSLFGIRSRARIAEFAALLALLTAACLIVFGDLPHPGSPARPGLCGSPVRHVGGNRLRHRRRQSFSLPDRDHRDARDRIWLTGPSQGTLHSSTRFCWTCSLRCSPYRVWPLAAVIAERERAKSHREQLIREQTAMEARLRLAAIVESSNDAIFSKSLDGIVLSWNAAAQRIFGFSEAEVVGQPAAMLVPPELEDEENRLLQRLRAGERIERFRTIRVTKTGDTINVSLTITPLTDSAGTLVGVAEIARDITEQDRAEQTLSSVSRRLIHAQEQERARIARELHDDIGQRLALLAIELTELSVGRAGLRHGSQTTKLQTAGRGDRHRYSGPLARAALLKTRIAGHRHGHERLLRRIRRPAARRR